MHISIAHIIFPFFNIGNALLSGRIPALFAKKGSD